MDFDEEDEVEVPVNNHYRHQLIDESNGITGKIDDNHGLINKSKTKISVQDNNNNLNDQQPPGDEWEEFVESNSKYDQLRIKFAHDENNDDYYDDENNHNTNFGENINNIDGEDDGEQSSRNNRRREQQKDKPVWNLDQVKQTSTNDLPTEKVDEPQPPPPSKPATSGVYKPPQLRGNSSVTVVSGINQRVSKKEKPNLASAEDFPMLGAAVNKK